MQEMKEMQVPSLGKEDPPGEGMATHSSILTCKIPWTVEPAGYSPEGRKESDTTERQNTHVASVAAEWSQQPLHFYLCVLNPSVVFDCSPPGSSVHGPLQASTVEWVAMSSSRGPSQPRGGTWVFCLLHWQTSSLSLVPPGRPYDRAPKSLLSRTCSVISL